mmetsp:Transcript_23653/g.42026  ORF Transcript_23653/g.42026 Transcript_23653/m.42026 type:complete len:212 (+) Transcript_23653:1010-1645(+)
MRSTPLRSARKPAPARNRDQLPGVAAPETVQSRHQTVVGCASSHKSAPPPPWPRQAVPLPQLRVLPQEFVPIPLLLRALEREYLHQQSPHLLRQARQHCDDPTSPAARARRLPLGDQPTPDTGLRAAWRSQSDDPQYRHQPQRFCGRLTSAHQTLLKPSWQYIWGGVWPLHPSPAQPGRHQWQFWEPSFGPFHRQPKPARCQLRWLKTQRG